MDRLIKLVNLANEANSLVNELGFLSIEITAGVFENRRELHLGANKFDEYKAKFGWGSQAKILSDKNYCKEYVFVDSVEIFCIKPVVAKEAV